MHDHAVNAPWLLSVHQSTTLLKLSQCAQLEGEREIIRRHCSHVLFMYQPLLYVILNKKGVIYSCTEQAIPILVYKLVHLLGMYEYEQSKLGM